MNVAGEPLTLGVPPRVLEARLVLPSDPVAGAVICHPHPQYGGDMDNEVVRVCAVTLAELGFAVLRFNFGGVGRSGGTHTGGPGEVDDAATALAALGSRLPPAVPLWLAGYSFGARVALQLAIRPAPPLAAVLAVAPPLGLLDWSFLAQLSRRVHIVAGDRDQFCPATRLSAVTCAHPGFRTYILPGADHFFVGQEVHLARAVRAAAGAMAP